MKRVDKVKRPDHYICLNCKKTFNEAKYAKVSHEDGFTILATCPFCGSAKIKISWWKKEKV